MEKLFYRYLCIGLCLILLVPNLQAQDYEKIIDVYMDQSDVFAPLYNGKLPPKYYSSFDGTYFIESETFSEGYVTYNHIRYHKIHLNLNAHLDELYITIPQRHLSCVLLKDYVSAFSLGQKQYIHIRQEDYPNAPSFGYYQVLHQGDKSLVVKRVRKSYSNANPNETRVAHRFDPVINFYVVRNGEFSSIKNKTSLLKIFPEYSKDIRHFIKNKRLHFGKSYREDSFAQCAAFVETLE